MTHVSRAITILATIGLLHATMAAQQPPPQFAPVEQFALSMYPNDITIGDLNEDGNPDIVTANWGSNNVSVLLGAGAESFEAETIFGVGSGPLSIDSGDLNEDGHLDVVTVNVGSTDISLLLGKGDGTFAPQAIWDVTDQLYPHPKSIKVVDMDGDGNLDVITGTDYLYVIAFPGTGAGSFGPKKLLFVNEAPELVAVADLNGDGILDIASPNGASNDVSVLLGTGAWGYFAKLFPVGEYFFSDIATGDVDGDGALDILTGHSYSGYQGVNVLLGTGTGSFGTATSVFDQVVSSFKVGDLSGDGKLDLVAVNGSTSVSVLLGTGTTGFGAATSLELGSGASSVAIGDVNGDGAADILAAASNTVSIFFNTTPTVPPAPWTDLGHGLPGTANQTPMLTGMGPMTPDSDNQITLTNALASSTTSLVAGLAPLDAPFKGGVLVPHPDFLLTPLPVSATGTHSLLFRWPVNAPAGLKLWFQHWVTDAEGPNGFSASNGLQAIGQ